MLRAGALEPFFTPSALKHIPATRLFELPGTSLVNIVEPVIVTVSLRVSPPDAEALEELEAERAWRVVVIVKVFPETDVTLPLAPKPPAAPPAQVEAGITVTVPAVNELAKVWGALGLDDELPLHWLISGRALTQAPTVTSACEPGCSFSNLVELPNMTLEELPCASCTVTVLPETPEMTPLTPRPERWLP